MNRQEIFETVAKHLFKQNEQSIVENVNRCRYRITQFGKVLKCAVGCLIPDELYHQSYDQGNDTTINGMLTIASDHGWELPTFISEEHEFLTLIQKIHDYTPNWRSSCNMRTALIVLAVAYNLDTSLVQNLKFKGK